jgi:hypothetical protein
MRTISCSSQNCENRLFQITLLCLIFICASGVAQDFSTRTPQIYLLQVKQFDEFVKRFNFKTDFSGNQISDSFPLSRKEYINLLFNAKDIRAKDSLFIALKEEFERFVTRESKPVYIDKYGKEITALAVFRVKYKGYEEDLSLKLKPEKLPEAAVKWTICEALLPRKPVVQDTNQRFIPPNANETNFIALKQLLNNHSALSVYANTGYKPDPLTLLFNELENRNLEIMYTSKLTYLIKLGDWQLTIEEFLRSDFNSGWLISDLKKGT